MHPSPTFRRRRFLGILFLAGLALASSCGHGTGFESTPVPEAQRLYSLRCGTCHEAYPPYAYAPREWPGIVDRMQGKAGLRDEEKRIMLQWLCESP